MPNTEYCCEPWERPVCIGQRFERFFGSEKMAIAESLLAEFEQESGPTRKFLERVPEDKLTWKAHEKSMTVGQLAMHMASFPGGVAQLAMQGEFQIPDFNRPNPQPQSVKEILGALDESITTVRSVLSKATDEQLAAPWKMKKGEKVVLEIPRAAFLRTILLNHWYHHRGQLGVYLRLLGAKVPATYGPSGDELPAFLGDV